MKTIIKSIILILVITLMSCQKEDLEFKTDGILVLTVQDEQDAPVANAQVMVYRSLDDWAFDERRLELLTTDEMGQITIQREEGALYFDLVKDNLNNWQTPVEYRVYEGLIASATATITDNINGIVSTTAGRRWYITRIYDENGNDLPEFDCVVRNNLTFTKAGAYVINDIGTRCDSLNQITEASWWGEGKNYIGLVLDDGNRIVNLTLSEVTEDRFVATEFFNGQIINYVYELV